MQRTSKTTPVLDLTPVAGNGLLDRRTFLRGGAAVAATLGGYGAAGNAAAEVFANDAWSLMPGAITRPYEQPSRFEEKVVRTLTNPKGETRVQNARTPLHLLNGTITPAGQHFVVAQSGAPDIDPAKHRIAIHGGIGEGDVIDVCLGVRRRQQHDDDAHRGHERHPRTTTGHLWA